MMTSSRPTASTPSARATGPSGSPLVGRGDADRTAAITRSLLGYGVLAGPFYLVVGLAQALTREGYDISRHDLSLLANGPLGWIQIVNLVLSGLMTVAAGVGMRRALRVLGGGRGAVWGPRLVAGYGLGLVGAGIFVADPMYGFPLGTPDGDSRHDHHRRRRPHRLRRTRVRLPRRGLPGVRAPLRERATYRPRLVLPRDRRALPRRLRRYRQRCGQPRRRSRLLGRGRSGLDVAGRHVDRPLPPHAPAHPRRLTRWRTQISARARATRTPAADPPG